jgi:hypothetical protein
MTLSSDDQAPGSRNSSVYDSVLIARAATRNSVVSEIKACSIASSFARWLAGRE